MIKVKVSALDEQTKEDITDDVAITVKNQTTGNMIIKRQDGYYHCNPDTLYSFYVLTDRGDSYCYDDILPAEIGPVYEKKVLV